MAVTGFFHHFGTFMLLVATALLIVTDVSAPVVNNLALLKVDLGNATSQYDSKVTFGTFGWCWTNTADGGRDYCSSHHVGYHPAQVMIDTEGTDFSSAAKSTTHGLSGVMILHPIATGIVFIAFLLALGAGFFGSIFAAFTALLGFIVTLVVLITDFVMFGIIKHDVNDDPTSSHATFSIAIWTLLVSAICSLIGAIIVFFTCCSARMHRQRTTTSKIDGYAPPARRRRWF